MEDKNCYSYNDRRTALRRTGNTGGLCRSCSRSAGLGSNGCGCGCGASRRTEVDVRGRNADCGCGASRRAEVDARGQTADCGCGASRRNGAEVRERNADCGCGASRRAEVDARGRNADCGCGASGRGNECGALMNRLQKLDFSIQETVLYLNAYPDCKKALEHYRALVKERCAVAAQYEKSCGALTMHGNGEREKWGWVDASWPWYLDFPGNRTW